MGHISPENARKLISQGLVTGVLLDLTDPVKPLFCESCVYAKSGHRPILKVREGEHAMVFGGEIHSDLWGPAPVKSRGGKRYYITFTDDKTRLTHLYLLQKIKLLTSTKNIKLGLTPSYLQKSKFFILIEVTNIKQRNSSLTSNPKVLSLNSVFMTLCSTMVLLNAVIKLLWSISEHYYMLADFQGLCGERWHGMSSG